MEKVKGVVPIIATPFTGKGKVDYDSLQNLVSTLIKGGCHGVTLFGIAGEYYKLTDEERKKMIKITVDECKKFNVPAVVSITEHSTEAAIYWAMHAEKEGADYLMLLPPFFLKPSGRALYQHMKKVAEAVKIPVIVQYAPEQTGVQISPEIFHKLSQQSKNITYYKIECKPAGPFISELLKLTDNKVDVLVGNAGFQMIEAFERGTIGVMPGCSMFDLYLKIYHSYIKGDKEEAFRIHNHLLPMLNHIRQNVEMIIYYEKKILKMRGIISSDYCRQPSFTADKIMDDLFLYYYETIRKHLS